MAIGSSGQPVDPIVVAQMRAGTYQPISLYYPGRGQYWLIFGPQAFVLTVNGQGLKTWSRYIFPDTITDWTLNAGVLYLRSAGNLIWQLDSGTLVDDYGGSPVNFEGIIQWPFIDGGVDLIGSGSLTLQIGWDQTDPTAFNDNPSFNTCATITPPYSLSAADTVPGQPIPMPLSAPSFTILMTFAGNQAWSFQAANLYLNNFSGAGVAG
jgi:hypothetical protein